MQAAIDQFRTNIDRVRNLGAIYKALRAKTTELLDLSDILRAELVLAVSALDQLIHELVRSGMLEAYHGGRVRTQAFLRFQITLESALQGIGTSVGDSWLDDQIKNRHGYQSFQHPDKIGDAIRLISDAQLWNEVADHLALTPEDVKQKLILIVDRRNQIAHEADMDPSFPDTRWPIDDALVDDAINFIERLATAVFRVVS